MIYGKCFVATIVLTLIAACAPALQDERPTPGPISESINGWSEVMQRTPYPYTTPLPPTESTILDATYTKVDPREGQRAPCRRCPPYPPEGGVWKLNLDQGIFRVYHAETGWRTVGSFIVSRDRIEFFNDPHCYHDVGIYTWEVEDGELMLEVVEDNCGTTLRKQCFTVQPWKSCQPPSEEAAITNHWPTPVGCDTASETAGE